MTVVDREALREQIAMRLSLVRFSDEESDRMIELTMREAWPLADAVLALLPTEAETKALAETAIKLGRRVGRKEAAEELAAWAIDLADGVMNPDKPYNQGFIHASETIARHAREITKGDGS